MPGHCSGHRPLGHPLSLFVHVLTIGALSAPALIANSLTWVNRELRSLLRQYASGADRSTIIEGIDKGQWRSRARLFTRRQ
jgi:hypothetical protein